MLGLLQQIQDNQTVSKWEIYRNRKALLAIMRDNPEQYDDIYEEVLDIIETAKESI